MHYSKNKILLFTSQPFRFRKKYNEILRFIIIIKVVKCEMLFLRLTDRLCIFGLLIFFFLMDLLAWKIINNNNNDKSYQITEYIQLSLVYKRYWEKWLGKLQVSASTVATVSSLLKPRNIWNLKWMKNDRVLEANAMESNYTYFHVHVHVHVVIFCH